MEAIENTQAKARRERVTGRIWQPDSGIWYIQYYVHGRQVRESTHSRDKEVAEHLLRERLGTAERVLARQQAYRDGTSTDTMKHTSEQKNSTR